MNPKKTLPWASIDDRRVDDDDAVVERLGRVVGVGAVEHHALESARRRVDVVAVEKLAAGAGNVNAIASGERDVEARRPIVRRKNIVGVGRPQQCAIEAGAGFDAEASGGAGLHGHEHRVVRRDDRRAIVDQERAVRRILGRGSTAVFHSVRASGCVAIAALRRMLCVTSVTPPGGTVDHGRVGRRTVVRAPASTAAGAQRKPSARPSATPKALLQRQCPARRCVFIGASCLDCASESNISRQSRARAAVRAG